jgi:predicted  nucleic acid-binding Zn ribbon protein
MYYTSYYSVKRLCKKCKQRKQLTGGIVQPTKFVCKECRKDVKLATPLETPAAG